MALTPSKSDSGNAKTTNADAPAKKATSEITAMQAALSGLLSMRKLATELGDGNHEAMLTRLVREVGGLPLPYQVCDLSDEPEVAAAVQAAMASAEAKTRELGQLEAHTGGAAALHERVTTLENLAGPTKAA
jgi:hypothetical protein